jgi:glycosyltransferase involved in cell wall biosynthesis
LKTLEIILPVRNPTEVLARTASSIAGQTDRGFSILISDNHSTKGGEWIDAAANEFHKAGISVRRIKPPVELGRVEHWNWVHHQTDGEWLKPIFAGDWLELNYVVRLRATSAANPACRYIFTCYTLHQLNEAPAVVSSPWIGRFYPPAEMTTKVLRYGMQFGPPSAAAYERTAFFEAGGYPTPLPICSDSLLFCSIAARYGVFGLAEPLCHFNIHGARFSTGLGEKKKLTFQETITYLWLLGYQAWSEKTPFSKGMFLKMLLREVRNYRRAINAK